MSEAGATIPGMDSNRPAIHALAAAVAVIRARNGVPGPAPTVTEVAAVVDGQQMLVEPITVPADWLDNDDVDRTFVPVGSPRLTGAGG